MRTLVKLRTLAAVIAVAAAAGCSPAPAASHAQAGGGPAGYWTGPRLLGAAPWRGPGYRPGQQATAHPAVQSLRVGALFEHDASGDHSCTASVVAQPGPGPADHRRALHPRREGTGATGRTSCSSLVTGTARRPIGIWNRRAAARRATMDKRVRSRPRRRLRRPRAARWDQNIEDVLGANQLGHRLRDTSTSCASPATPTAPMLRSPASTGPPGRAPRSCGSTAAGSPTAPAAARGSRTSTRGHAPAPSSG